jgi:AraC-like DNA-binding protein
MSLVETDSDCPADVTRVLEEIHSHLFDSELTIERVKQKCGIGDNNISSRFRYFVGCKPSRYILRHRLKMARHLLGNFDVKVGDVAFSIGYSSVGAFSTMFKRKEGCTPSSYKKEEK